MSTEQQDQPAGAVALQQEWLMLQQQTEQQERQALQIKLAAVVLTAVGWFAEAPLLTVALVPVLWLQEAIGRTQQARLFDYLLHIEAALRAELTTSPMQLNSRWLATRGGSGRLLLEYARHGARPTVLFPYLPLLLLAMLVWWCG